MTQQHRRPVQVATYVTPDVADRLDQQAAAADMSRAELVRRVLHRWMENVEGGGDTSLESRESQLANREVLGALSEITQGLTDLKEAVARPEHKPRRLGQRILDVFRGDPG